MRIDFERLERMRRGEKLARSTSLGLSYQIIEVERSRTRAVGRVDEVKMRAQALGGSPMMRPGETEADAADRRNAEANARAEQRARLRQTLRGHPEALGEALQQLETVNADDFAVALAEAEDQLRRVDEEIATLRAEQGKWGSRTGALRASIDLAERWLATHPEALEEIVEDAA
jgi:chromosome segregation ATPase